MRPSGVKASAVGWETSTTLASEKPLGRADAGFAQTKQANPPEGPELSGLARVRAGLGLLIRIPPLTSIMHEGRASVHMPCGFI